MSNNKNSNKVSFVSIRHTVVVVVVVVVTASIVVGCISINISLASDQNATNDNNNRIGLNDHLNNGISSLVIRLNFNNNNSNLLSAINDTLVGSNNIASVSSSKRRNQRKLQSALSIELQLINMSAVDQDIFETAASRWSSIVHDDLPSYDAVDLPAVDEPGCKYPTTIDDLYICGKFSTIDGSLKILAYSGPAVIARETVISKWFPVTGVMVFDSSDIAYMKSKDNFDSVILHEMGHVLGIGTLWDRNGVIGSSSTCPYYGKRGNAVYRSLSRCLFRRLPTEQGGSSGTKCGHFSESCFQNELMTGYADLVDPLSRLSIASLEDIGYTQLDYSKADRYTAADMSPSCKCKFFLRRYLERKRNNNNNNYNRYKQGVSKVTSNTDNTMDEENELEFNKNKQRFTKRRELSAEGRKYATDFGVKLLKERQQRYKNNSNKGTTATTSTISTTTKLIDVLDAVILLYYENGQIHDVHVTSADFDAR